jgi:hypothetical protein
MKTGLILWKFQSMNEEHLDKHTRTARLEDVQVTVVSTFKRIQYFAGFRLALQLQADGYEIFSWNYAHFFSVPTSG